MKKRFIIISIYLIVFILILRISKSQTDEQKEQVIQSFYEKNYNYFDMYEFFLRQLIAGEISNEAFEMFLKTSAGNNYDVLILTPSGHSFNDTANFNNAIPPIVMESIIISTLQNPLSYFSNTFTEGAKSYMLTAKKINFNVGERWSLIVISDVSTFFNDWSRFSGQIWFGYCAIWTIFFFMVIFFYYKKKLSFGLEKEKIDIHHFISNTIRQDDKALAFMINEDSEIEAVSQRVELILDYKEEFLVGKNISFIIEDFNLPKLIKPNKAGEHVINEITIHDKKGTAYTFLMNLLPYFSESTEFYSALIILSDITFLREKINRLDFEVKKNVSLSTIAQLVMSVSNPKDIITLIMEEARNLLDFDYATTFLLKDGLLKPYYTDNPNIITKIDKFSIKLGHGLTGTVAKTGKAQIANDAANNPLTIPVPGTPVVQECIMSAPMINSEGKVIGAVTVSRENLNGFTDMELQLFEVLLAHTANIFDKTELLNQILEEKERHNILINESALAILIVYDKIIIFCNKMFCNLIKYEKEDLLGKNIIDFISPKNSSFFISQLTTFTLSGRTEVFEYEFITSEGNTIILEFSLSSIVWDGKTSILASANDVTEKMELNKKMLQMQKLEGIGTLTSGIAHDFKNILTGIVGAVELILLRTEEGTSVRKMAKIIKSSADRAVKLSQRLLGFSRKVDDEITVFDINDLLRETIEIVSFTFDKNIEIVTDLTNDPLFFEGDAVQIQQCVMNLLVNARDVMPKGGNLYIKTKFLNNFDQIKQIWDKAENIDYTYIEVTDTGPGVPENIQELLFEPFFSTKNKDQGTGLGLSTTRNIINKYRGNIFLKSELKVGTSFFILLPWIPEFKDDNFVYSNDDAIKSLPILLVDDEEMVLDIAKDLLEELGSTVYTANNGYEALDVLLANPQITLAIIDRIMPKIDGLTLLKQIKEKRPELKVIVSSGFLQDNIIQELVEAGAYQCITKPYRLEQLASILRGV